MRTAYYGAPLVVDALGRVHGFQPDGSILVPPHHWMLVRLRNDGQANGPLMMLFMGGMN